MAFAERFEDLIAWQKSRELTRAVYEITNQPGFTRDHSLRDQIRRSSISVMSNIAEGFDRKTRKEFRQFLVYAKGSCAEVRSQLYIAYDVGYIDQIRFDELHALAEEISKITSGLIASIS